MTENTRKKPIIVGVDGSESSVAALKLAAQIAAALDAPIEVLSTWEYPGIIEAYQVTNWSPLDDTNALVDDCLEIAFHGTLPDGFTRTAMRGNAAATLIEASKRATMLVLGSRGRGGFLGLLLGSVSSSCAAHAHSPVLITRS